MDFVLTLHSHLPYVLNHGRWPHGSDWICEATLDTYLPLLETLRGLADQQIAAPVTIGFTPVLANQLASPVFVREMETFFAQRLAACAEAPASLAKTGESALLPLARCIGGLADTVQDGVTGFLFDEYDAGSFARAAGRAVRQYAERVGWRKMICEAMSRDFAWERSEERYLSVYRGVLAAGWPHR